MSIKDNIEAMIARMRAMGAPEIVHLRMEDLPVWTAAMGLTHPTDAQMEQLLTGQFTFNIYTGELTEIEE